MSLMTDWTEDLENDDLPHDLDSYDKAPDRFQSGMRLAWWYQDDVDYAKEYDIDLNSEPPFQGIAIIAPDKEIRDEWFEGEDCVIVMDEYPIEKCYCESTYLTLRRLLDNDELVRVIAFEK